MKAIQTLFLGSLVLLTGCSSFSSSSGSEKKPAAATSKVSYEIDVKVEMETVSRKAKIIAVSTNGMKIEAQNNYNHTWSVEGENSVGGIIFADPITHVVVYQSTSMSSPVQSLSLDPKGDVIRTEFNSFGSKKTIAFSADREELKVEIINSPKEILTAQKESEGHWKITGYDSTGQKLEGSLSIDPKTKEVSYKGSNGDFTLSEPASIDDVVAAMSLIKESFTQDSLSMKLSTFSHEKEELIQEVSDLLYSILMKIQ